MLVQDPHGLAARVDGGEELLVQTRGAQRGLAGLDVHVEHAALGARGGRGLQVVDGGFDAAEVQDARQDEAAEASADDRDGVVGSGGHGALLRE